MKRGSSIKGDLMQKIAFLFLALPLAAGCMSAHTDKVKTVTDRYERIVFDDGINQDEAMTIAQRSLIRADMARLYDLDHPKLYTEVDELPHHEDYWFVTFREIKRSNITFHFMSIVDKRTGKVKFADDYMEGRNWILEAALLK